MEYSCRGLRLICDSPALRPAPHRFLLPPSALRGRPSDADDNAGKDYHWSRKLEGQDARDDLRHLSISARDRAARTATTPWKVFNL